MITFQRETLYDLMDDAKPLLAMHYQELTPHKDQISLDPVWERYAALEKAGLFALYTARDGARLVGYSAFFVQPHIHYADWIVAANDVLFLHEDYRRGSCGIKLIKFSESQLKTIGAHQITFHVKYSKDFRKILYRLGYGDIEAVVGKII